MFLTHVMRTLDSKPQIERNDFGTAAEVDAYQEFTFMMLVIKTPLDLTSGMNQVTIFNTVRRLVDYVLDRSLLEADFQGNAIRITGSTDYKDPIVEQGTDSWASLPDNSVAIQIGGDSGATKDGSTVAITSLFKRLIEATIENDFKIPGGPDAAWPNQRAFSVPAGSILAAAGTFSETAVFELTGDLWKKGTLIDFAGTTSAGPFGLNAVVPRDMFGTEVALYLGEFLKGWSQSSFTNSRHPTNKAINHVAGIAAFGGLIITFDSLVITPV